MEKFYKRSMGLALAMLLAATMAFAQTTVSGTVKDKEGNPEPGAHVAVKGTILVVPTDADGKFTIKIGQLPPLTLVFSSVGKGTQEIEVTEPNANLDVVLEEDASQLNEIVIAGSRVEESILKSAVTVDKVDLRAIQQTPAPEFFDVLANVKGVTTSSGSLNFTQINTRGFASIANIRFVQLVDGMDTSAPLLNFPTGNIVGISELDAESMELVPGASSALYGPNAFNGILIMKSKSPFEYQGFSAQAKAGVTKSDARGSNPLFNFGLRYAKAWDRIAFKVNFSLMQATDWLGNDYRTDRTLPESRTDLSGNVNLNPDAGSNPSKYTSNFDGLNLYGDETKFDVPIPGGVFGTLKLARTGFREEDMLDNDEAKSMKYDAAIHYRITDNLEASYTYRYGGGSSVYQGTEKYALRDFTQQFHKVELKSKNFFVRAYMTETKDGDSWNMSAQGGFANEYLSPTATKWAPDYAQRYVLSMQGYIPGVTAGDQVAAHREARRYADNVDGDNGIYQRPVAGSKSYDSLMNVVRGNLFQGTPPGSSFVDNSKLYHAEFNYNFVDLKVVDVMVGGNFRNYNLFSDATVFNEDPDGDGKKERVNINEYGFYTQVAKTFAEALRLTGSLRYDKNENFDGRVTPRVSAVYTFKETNNIRLSFQTGFRNPDTQAQFIYFPSSGGTLLGSTEANAKRYGVHNGGAWTQQSYNEFKAAGGAIDTDGNVTAGNAGLLQTANIKYVKPERLKSVEVGYKGLLNNVLLIDLNGYYTIYNDFIGGEIVAIDHKTTHQGGDVNAGSLYSLYSNKEEEVKSSGVGLGLNYILPRGFSFDGSYSYATYETDAKEGSNFRAGFNTPENKFSVGLSNKGIYKNLGFSVNYRWQEGFLWESSYGTWNVPEVGVMDAQLSYKISSIKTIAKVGGTNLLGGDYRTNFGAPFVGQQFYISLTFDPLVK